MLLHSEKYNNSLSLFLSVLVVLGFELRALCLLGKLSTIQSLPLALFTLGYFSDFCLGWLLV
jgi:hypothetical protein